MVGQSMVKWRKRKVDWSLFILIKWKIYINARLELTFKSIFKLAAKGNNIRTMEGRKELTAEEEQAWMALVPNSSKEREKLKGIFGREKDDKIEKRWQTKRQRQTNESGYRSFYSSLTCLFPFLRFFFFFFMSKRYLCKPSFLGKNKNWNPTVEINVLLIQGLLFFGQFSQISLFKFFSQKKND